MSKEKKEKEDKKIRVFISQIMRDKPYGEIKAERAAVKNALHYGFMRECNKIIDALRLVKPIHPKDNDPAEEIFEELSFRVKAGKLVCVKKCAEEYITRFSKPHRVDIDWLEFLDNFMPDLEVPEDVRRDVYYLSKSTEVLSHADLVVFTRDWENGRGTFLEHYICQKYKIPRIELTY